MNYSRALKPKAQRNRIFKRNERSIRRAIFKLLITHRGRLTVKQVVKETGLSKRTVYVHYPDLGTAPEDIDQQIIHEFNEEIDSHMDSLVKIISNHNERVFYSIFVFIAKRKELFCQICSSAVNQDVLCKMIESVYTKLKIIWFPLNAPPPQIGSDRVDMYISMVIEIIRKWSAQTHCDIRKSSQYIRRLMRLTLEASIRCK